MILLKHTAADCLVELPQEKAKTLSAEAAAQAGKENKDEEFIIQLQV